MFLKEPIILQFLLLAGVVVLIELILTVSTLGACDGPKRTDF